MELDGLAPTFSNVVARGTGAELGAVAGTREGSPPRLRGIGPGGWDTGITREGAPVENDPAFSGALGIAGIVTPSMIPPPVDANAIVTPSM